MKKFFILAALTVGFGSFVTSYADSSSTACTVSSDEQAFMNTLSDANKTAFCQMSEEQRAACMQMTKTMDDYGNQMTSDEAVQSMASNMPSN